MKLLPAVIQSRTIEIVLIGGPNNQQRYGGFAELPTHVGSPRAEGEYLFHRSIYLGDQRVDKYVWHPAPILTLDTPESTDQDGSAGWSSGSSSGS